MEPYPEFICSGGMRLPVEVRLSSRARYQRVTLHHKGTLEVVIPKDGRRSKTEASPERVGVFLEEKRAWIERAARTSAPQIEAYRQSLAAGLPTALDFLAVGETWSVEYHKTPATRITTKHTDDRAVRLYGPIGDEERCYTALRAFAAGYARGALPLLAWCMVEKLEAAGQLPRRPSSVTVNNRKSAWGVCTRDGRIRLDRRVVFLPEGLARQVVMHELAHLTHLNHAKAFYDELFSYEGSTREAERALKRASQHIPAWL